MERNLRIRCARGATRRGNQEAGSEKFGKQTSHYVKTNGFILNVFIYLERETLIIK